MGSSTGTFIRSLNGTLTGSLMETWIGCSMGIQNFDGKGGMWRREMKLQSVAQW